MINVMTAWKKVHSHSGQLSKKDDPIIQSLHFVESSSPKVPAFSPICFMIMKPE